MKLYQIMYKSTSGAIIDLKSYLYGWNWLYRNDVISIDKSKLLKTLTQLKNIACEDELYYIDEIVE